MTTTLDLDAKQYKLFRRTFDALTERQALSDSANDHLKELNGLNPDVVAFYLERQNERLPYTGGLVVDLPFTKEQVESLPALAALANYFRYQKPQPDKPAPTVDQILTEAIAISMHDIVVGNVKLADAMGLGSDIKALWEGTAAGKESNTQSTSQATYRAVLDFKPNQIEALTLLASRNGLMFEGLLTELATMVIRGDIDNLRYNDAVPSVAEVERLAKVWDC